MLYDFGRISVNNFTCGGDAARWRRLSKIAAYRRRDIVIESLPIVAGADDAARDMKQMLVRRVTPAALWREVIKATRGAPEAARR